MKNGDRRKWDGDAGVRGRVDLRRGSGIARRSMISAA